MSDKDLEVIRGVQQFLFDHPEALEHALERLTPALSLLEATTPIIAKSAWNAALTAALAEINVADSLANAETRVTALRKP
jgi:trans-aconitate methyltransferase